MAMIPYTYDRFQYTWSHQLNFNSFRGDAFTLGTSAPWTGMIKFQLHLVYPYYCSGYVLH